MLVCMMVSINCILFLMHVPFMGHSRGIFRNGITDVHYYDIPNKLVKSRNQYHRYIQYKFTLFCGML